MYMQAREAREQEEMLLAHKRKMADLEGSHAAEISALKRKQEQMEEEAKEQVRWWN